MLRLRLNVTSRKLIICLLASMVIRSPLLLKMRHISFLMFSVPEMSRSVMSMYCLAKIIESVRSSSSCIQGNHFCSTVTPHGSRKTTAHSTSPWAATTEQKCVNWLACSFSTDWPTNTEKKVSDSTGTTGSQFSRTPQDHKQNESGKTSLDTSRTTDSRLLYRPT